MSPRLAVAVVALMWSARAAHGDPTTDAERQYTIGQAAYDDHRYDDALTAWQHSYDLSHAPALLFNLAQAYRLRGAPGDCARARDDYGEFIARNPAAAQRVTAGELFREMRQCADREAKAAGPRPAPVVVPPPALPAEVPPPRPAQARAHGHGTLIAGIATAVGGVAALGVGLGFGARASTLGSRVQTACMTSCEWSELRTEDADGHRDTHVGWALDGIGAAAVAVGGVLIWRGAREHADPAPVAIAPVTGGAVAAWSGTW